MKKVWLTLMLFSLILCMSCRPVKEGETEYTEMTAKADSSSPEEEASASPEEKEEERFIGDSTYVISLEDCILEYDHDGISVYSGYVTNGMEIEADSDFPYFQYVLYIETPFMNQQIFPVKDFIISHDSAVLYMIREKNGFESLQKIDISNLRKEKKTAENLNEEIINSTSLEDLLKNTYDLSDENGFSDLHFKFTDLDSGSENPVLKGEAEGIYTAAGEKYYIDLEWNDNLKEMKAAPCILKIYDPQKDAEAFEKCNIAFDQIEQGNWSDVVPHKNMEDKWNSYKLGYEKNNLAVSENADWLRTDLNNDGMPELVSQSGSGDRTEHKKPVDLIFAWQDNKVELVYIDFTDAMEFLFVSDSGKLIYESTVLVQSSEYTKFHFDEKWNLAFEDSLSLCYFYDEEEMYYARYRPKTKEELENTGTDSYRIKLQLTQHEFLEAYRNMTGQDFFGDHAGYWEDKFQEAITEEKLYDYEIRADENGRRYAVLKGFREEYKDDFKENLRKLHFDRHPFSFPETLEGVTVKEISDHAFQNIDLGSYCTSLELSSDIISIGEHCFENCGLTDVTFMRNTVEKEAEAANSEHKIPIIGNRAFAGNEDLWGVYLNEAETVFGKEVFAECAPKLYLCYNPQSEEKNKALLEYAGNNHLEAVEIPIYFSREPVVRYPDEPLTLTSEVRNFFYGDSADDENFCSFEYADDAVDFGFPEWYLPCGEFCAMQVWKREITASSSLASSDGRYDAVNLGCLGRESAWAEGADGYGIGESVSITQCCSYGEKWSGNGTVYFYEGDMEPDIRDGYMRYTQICVVNGYARDQKTWEENGRVKRLLMYVEDRPYAYLELEDTIRPQYFTLPINDIKAADGVDIHFKFEIEDIYPGSKYEDTCLTGLDLEFMGRRGH